MSEEETTGARVDEESSYLHFGGMAWPNPDDPRGVEHSLRYGTPTRTDLLIAASVMGAYRQLVTLPIRDRNDRVKDIRVAKAPRP